MKWKQGHTTQSMATATLIIIKFHSQTPSRPRKFAQNIMTPKAQTRVFEARWKKTLKQSTETKSWERLPVLNFPEKTS